jgi:glycosyltransferase involved in cell wall biosynthesis
VTICACTYRRPEGLRALLDGVGAQAFRAIPAPRLSIVIADNEGSDAAREACDAFAQKSGMALRYVREPRRGIPFARNACLDQLPADSEWIAMIDDDEIPAPDWIEQLLLCQRRTEADVVQGRVVPRFPAAAPDWIRNGAFFGWPFSLFDDAAPSLRDGADLNGAATNNVLVRRAALGHPPLRFDVRMPLAGWDDSLFFRTLAKRGARMVFADGARVEEIVPPERTRLRYLLRVAYRQGAKKFGIKRMQDDALAARGVLRLRLRLRTALRGAAAIGRGAGRLVAALAAGPALRRRAAIALAHAASGVGMIASAAGARSQHYR